MRPEDFAHMCVLSCHMSKYGGGGFVFVNINQISRESIMKELKIISTVHPSIIDTSFMF